MKKRMPATSSLRTSRIAGSGRATKMTAIPAKMSIANTMTSMRF
jgi:hypothetical protein